MQPVSDKKLLGLLLTLMAFSVAFAMTYYNPGNRGANYSVVIQNDLYDQNPISQYLSDTPDRQVVADRILLKINQRFVFNKTCLVFKSFNKGNINLDFYLLEFDPDIPHPLSFTKKAFKKGVRLENYLYKLVSVKKDRIRLKILRAN